MVLLCTLFFPLELPKEWFTKAISVCCMSVSTYNVKIDTKPMMNKFALNMYFGHHILYANGFENQLLFLPQPLIKRVKLLQKMAHY